MIVVTKYFELGTWGNPSWSKIGCDRNLPCPIRYDAAGSKERIDVHVAACLQPAYMRITEPSYYTSICQVFKMYLLLVSDARKYISMLLSDYLSMWYLNTDMYEPAMPAIRYKQEWAHSIPIFDLCVITKQGFHRTIHPPRLQCRTDTRVPDCNAASDTENPKQTNIAQKGTDIKQGSRTHSNIARLTLTAAALLQGRRSTPC